MSADKTPEELAEEDGRVDLKAIMIIFAAFVLGALYFASGWTF